VKTTVCATLASLVLVSCAAPETRPPAPVASGDKCGGAERFVDRGDSVLDTRTGLTWRRCPVGQAFNKGARSCQGGIYATDTLAKARRAAESEAAASKQAWRLPSIDELSAVADKACAATVRSHMPGIYGAPMFTGSAAGAGKIYQFDPAQNKRVAESESDAPGTVVLVR
jgi:hypothetical protein